MFNPMNMFMMNQMMRGGSRIVRDMSNMTPEQKAQMQAMGQNAINSASQFANTGISLIRTVLRVIVCGILFLFFGFLLITYFWSTATFGGERSVVVIIGFLFLLIGIFRKMIGKTFLPRRRRNSIPSQINMNIFPPQ